MSIKTLVPVLTGGALLGLSFPPFGWTICAWFALSPVFYSVVKLNVRSAFLAAWTFQIALLGIAFFWPVFHIRIETAVISLTALISLSIVLASPFSIGAYLSQKWPDQDRKLAVLMFTGSLVILMEILLENGPVPMPWTTLGNSQVSSDVYVWFASIVGASGIGVLVVFSNVLLAAFFLDRFRFGWIPAFVFALVTIIPVNLGTSDARRHSLEPSILVGIVQPGYEPERWADISDFSRVDTLLSMSMNLLREAESTGGGGSDLAGGPDIIVWPETALPFSPDSARTGAMQRRLTEWAIENQVHLLTGGILASESGPTRPVGHNPAFFRNTVQFYSRHGELTIRGKNIMVPFAEYVPLSATFPGLAALAVPAGGVAGYLPDEQPSLVAIDGLSIGVLICFESLFPSYTRELATSGAQVLIVLTQDGWWNRRAAYEQHFQFARYRAAETGLSVVQVSVDGISGVILPDGSTTDLIDTGKSGTRTVRVSVARGDTVFLQFGYLFRILALLIWTGTAFIIFRR